jgi:hypothetical protein
MLYAEDERSGEFLLYLGDILMLTLEVTLELNFNVNIQRDFYGEVFMLILRGFFRANTRRAEC